MSSSADYSKLKVPELRDILTKRNLPTNGIKADLITRLTTADTTTTADASSPATNQAHLPTADDYEVDWDDNDEPAVPAPVLPPAPTTIIAALSAAPAAPTAPAVLSSTPVAESAVPTTASDFKPKRKFVSIAALFESAPTSTTPATTPSTTKTPSKPAKDHNSQSPSSPSTVNDDPSASTASTSAPKSEPSFAAGLKASPLDVELERRKARAKRFGIEAEAPTIEETKKLEREKRFGAEKAAPKKEVVKGLDAALPERRERKRGPSAHAEGARGKRSRAGTQQVNHNGSGAARGGEKRPNQGPRRNIGGGVQKSAYKGVLDDPNEKAKAEARARKFGLAQ